MPPFVVAPSWHHRTMTYDDADVMSWRSEFIVARHSAFRAMRSRDPKFDAALEAGCELIACWTLPDVMFLGLYRLGNVFVVGEVFDDNGEVRMWTGFTQADAALAYFDAQHRELDEQCVGEAIGCAFMDPRCPRYPGIPSSLAKAAKRVKAKAATKKATK